jgi:heme exporter protein C
MKKNWWKVICVLLLGFAVIYGMLTPVPVRFILNETIRNLFYHVPMWFGMITLFGTSCVYSVKYLNSLNPKDDIKAVEYANVGVLYSVCGMLTGMVWAKYTWGSPWSNDPKELSAALCMLIYFAYLILRSGIKDNEKRARLSAVYNIFAFAISVPLIFILPRLVDSLHPGNGGNPGFNAYDLDSRLRIVFYPAVAGWIMLAFWIASLRIRYRNILLTNENEHDFLNN